MTARDTVQNRPAADQPTHIEVHGARVNNLKNIDVDIPLQQLTAIAGVSGSGKSSLAMGVLYAEGSRRYIEALSTYTRRRMWQATRADVDRVTHVPAALALRQRPPTPGVRSTFGTATELLNVIRLMFSRLGRHRCPNGHYHQPTLAVAAEKPLTCAECGVEFYPPGAEDLAFNSRGACETCEGIGTIREVDDTALIKDPDLSIDDGTVLPWQTFGFNVQPAIAREFGVRTDVPWRDLTDHEREIVFAGPEEKKHITVTSKKGIHELDFTFRNARLTVTEELKRADNDKRLAKVSRFLTERTCPKCHGTRLSATARTPLIGDDNLADITALALDDVLEWSTTVATEVPAPMRSMAETLVVTLQSMAERLVELGLGYLSLDRAGATLSTGERQRVQLARAVRNETTGVLYVLDEPSIGLHPANIEGLHGVIRDLLRGGNTVVMVDHDPAVLAAADHLIEIGPGSGRDGGEVTAQGAIEQVADSLIGGYITGRTKVAVRGEAAANTESAAVPGADADSGARADADVGLGAIHMETTPIHTVQALDVDVPLGKMTVVTGPSGSGKTTMVLESLVPAVQGAAEGGKPEHVRVVDAAGIDTVHVVDATPIGANVRSTVGTYTGVLDVLRRIYAGANAGTLASDGKKLKPGAFSFNTGILKCPACEGTGTISLDVQFLPDVDITCPDCGGSRYSSEAESCLVAGLSLPTLLAKTVAEALEWVADVEAVDKRFGAVRRTLQAMSDVGLGYLTLNEATPALSGGEAQRLKLVSQLHRKQNRALFVFDEPTVGLHPRDVETLLQVLQRLIDKGATILVIEHDVDLIRNADYIIDLGPGGGVDGGRIVATGTPSEVAANPASVTGRYL